MKKRTFTITLISLFVSLILLFFPFLEIKEYKPLIGFQLIFSVFRRFDIAKTSLSAPDLIFIDNSFPLMLVFIAILMTTVLLLSYKKSRKTELLNSALISSSAAFILYGYQLSNSETTVADFFGRLLTCYQAADGNMIYKLADKEVVTGSGAKLLVFGLLFSLFFVILLKIEEYREKNKENKIQTPLSILFKNFKRNKLAIFGLTVIFILIMFSFYGPVFSKYAMLETNISLAKKLPSIDFLLGTDRSGRDILTRLMYGGRISLTVGFAAVFLQVVMGTLVGGVAGYYGGKIDNVLMRIVDIFMGLPYLPVVILIGAVMSDLNILPQYRIYFVMLIIGLLGWTLPARIVRGQILSLREQEFMLAAEVLGLRDSSKILRHLIPNVIPNIIVTATLGMGDAILSESALSFLGLGVSTPYPSWGNIIQAVREPNDFALRPWLWMPAGILILITVMTINFVGDGLRDVLDPKMNR